MRINRACDVPWAADALAGGSRSDPAGESRARAGSPVIHAGSGGSPARGPELRAQAVSLAAPRRDVPDGQERLLLALAHERTCLRDHVDLDASGGLRGERVVPRRALLDELDRRVRLLGDVA